MTRICDSEVKDEAKAIIATIFAFAAVFAGIADGLTYGRLVISLFGFSALYLFMLGIVLAMMAAKVS